MAKRLLQDYGIFEELTSAEQEKLLALAAEREYPPCGFPPRGGKSSRIRVYCTSKI